jgi:hypothetical protein
MILSKYEFLTNLEEQPIIALFKYVQKKEEKKLIENSFFIKNKSELVKVNKNDIRHTTIMLS